MVAIVVGLVVIVLPVWVVATYNRLVSLRNRREEAWSGIDVQLQRRADLLPNLVETVKGYAAHEREALERVIAARNRLVKAEGPREAGEADQQVEAATRQLFALAEGYPDLKASTNFLQLQHDLTKIEEDVAFSRKYHNAVVEDLNTMIQSFPSVLVARAFSFEKQDFFRAEAADRLVPTAEFE